MTSIWAGSALALCLVLVGSTSLAGPPLTFAEADELLTKACGHRYGAGACEPLPDPVPAWLAAAKANDEAARAAPQDPAAPGAIYMSSYAYRQAGDFRSALAEYQFFISTYGDEATLKALQPDQARYDRRLQAVVMIHVELAAGYVSLLDYRKAAETYATIAQVVRYKPGYREDAARNAVALFSVVGDRDRMVETYRFALGLVRTPADKASLDYLVASHDFNQWKPRAPDEGPNRAVRVAAQRSMAAYYNANKGNPAAATETLEAAWRAAKLMKLGGDPSHRAWFQNTQAAWAFLDAHPAGTPKESEQAPYADYGAEAEFTLLDEEIHDTFDSDTGHHLYSTMTAEDIFGKIDPQTGQFVDVVHGVWVRDTQAADAYDLKLKHVGDTYRSPEFKVASLARRGSLSDSLRSALYVCAGGSFNRHLFPPAITALLLQWRNSGNPALVDKADTLEGAIKDGWKYWRGTAMEATDRVMVTDYAQAIALAATTDTSQAAVRQALARLAFFSDSGTELGEGPHGCQPPKLNVVVAGPTTGFNCGLAPYVTSTPDPTDPTGVRRLSYTPRMYVLMSAGLPAVLPDDGAARPVPPPSIGP